MLMLNRLACLCPKGPRTYSTLALKKDNRATAKGESVELGSNEPSQHCAVT